MSTYGYLAHYGVQGMRWGVRNYQYKDGRRTSLGKTRYSNKSSNSSSNKPSYSKVGKKYVDKSKNSSPNSKNSEKGKKIVKALIISSIGNLLVATAIGTGVLIYKNTGAGSPSNRSINRMINSDSFGPEIVRRN